MRIPYTLPLFLLSALLAVPAAGQKVYKIVNPDGTISYTDRRPESLDNVEVIKTRAEQQRVMHLRIEERGAVRRAVASNLIQGPLQVELRFQGESNVQAEPGLPLRVVIPAATEQAIADIRAIDRYQPSRFELSTLAVPGDPAAQPEDFDYLLPVDTSQWRIDQGWNGAFSHNNPQSQHAIDINVDEGTPVRAARAGTIMQVEDDFEGAGLDREKYAGRANHVRVLHDDGSMAVYAHLQSDSVLARPGARVRQGQQIGLSGNTGFSTGPHLHFAIQVNAGMRLESIPFRMQSPVGPVSIPQR